MDIKKVTIITALFDIERDKWDNYTMSYHTYIMWMRSILYLDTNLIVYTEPKFKDLIVQYRREVDPYLKKTIIYTNKVENLPSYKKFYRTLKDLMDSQNFKNKIQFKVPEMLYPLYNIVMFAKLFYILDAKYKNGFDTDLFVWADAGLLRVDHPVKNVKWPDYDKINNLPDKITFFSHHSYVTIENKEEHCLSQSRFIQGGSIFIPVEKVEEVCQEFEETVNESIQQGYTGSDEKMLDLLYLKNPENYNLIKCGWREYFDMFGYNNI